MTTTHERLEALADTLERHGEDPARVEIVRRATRFKRSWVELADALCRLRDSHAYESWGYGDLHEYCHRELAIKPSTADKLMMSFGTVQRHAPEVLERDGVAQQIPSPEAVDYFTRALRDHGEDDEGSASRRLDAPRDVIDQLRSAVFDEGSSVTELRQRFNPVLRPKPEGAEERELLRKARGAAQRLSELVHQIPELSEARVARVDAVVEVLLKDLEGLLQQLGAGTTAVGTPAPAVMKSDASTRRRPRGRRTVSEKSKTESAARATAAKGRTAAKGKTASAKGKATSAKAKAATPRGKTATPKGKTAKGKTAKGKAATSARRRG